MALQTFKEGSRVSILLPEKFGFEIRHDFREATLGHPSGTSYELDFQAVAKMDSSAMGMLLLLKESAGKDSPVLLKNVRPEVANVLRLANFQKLFQIIPL